MTRVAFVTSEYVMPGHPAGGLATYVKKTGAELAQRGGDVWVFVASPRNTSWKDGPLTISEVRTTSLLAGFAARLPLVGRLTPAAERLTAARRLARRVRKLHRHHPFDIVQTSNYRAIGYSLRHDRRFPVVCRLSSYAPLYRSAYGRTRNLVESVCDWLEVRQVLGADACFAPSHFLADAYARMEGYRPAVIRTPAELPEITVDSSFYRANLEGLPYLLYFGSLSRTKGVDLLGDALPPVLARHPELRFALVGRDDGLPGGQSLAGYLRSRCGDHAPRLLFSQPLPREQLYPVIANAIGVVLPSRVDNYPNACLEAQWLGAPVVGTRDSSLDEMIADGDTGYLVDNGDPAGLAEAIERLLAQTPAERARMKERLSAHVAQIASEDRIGLLEAFYEAVIAQFRKGRR